MKLIVRLLKVSLYRTRFLLEFFEKRMLVKQLCFR